VVLLTGNQTQMLDGMKALPARLTQLALGYTVSLGAVLIRPEEDLASGIHRADKAMYTQKNLSRHPGSLRTPKWSGALVHGLPRWSGIKKASQMSHQ
jgi:hypothetical protein